MALIGREVGVDLDRIVAFLESSAAWVADGLAQADAEGDDDTDLDFSLSETATTWFEILDEFDHDGERHRAPEDSNQDQEIIDHD